MGLEEFRRWVRPPSLMSGGGDPGESTVDGSLSEAGVVPSGVFASDGAGSLPCPSGPVGVTFVCPRCGRADDSLVIRWFGSQMLRRCGCGREWLVEPPMIELPDGAPVEVAS